MGFWIFMLAMGLLFPAIMISFGAVGLAVSLINTVVLIVPVFFAEKALNKTFDKDGNRKAE